MRYLLISLFFILFIGSIIFARERILFCDASFILTEILNADSLRIQEHRYGSFVTQLFPLLAGKAHLPLKDIILLYSISFNLFYLAVAAILLFRFRNIKLAILMAFYYTLFVTDTYFWTNNELHQAIAWMFLLAGFVMDYKKRSYSFFIHLPIFVLLSFLSFFTHPLILLVLPFLWLFILLDKSINPYNLKKVLLLSGLLLIICATKFYIMKQGGYDNEKLNAPTHISIKDVIKSFASPMARIVYIKMLTQYFFIPILFIAGAWIAWKAKQYKHLLLTLVFTAGYFAAVCLTFNDFVPFYAESEWMPFTIITSLLFVYYVLPKIKPAMAVALLSIIFIVRIGYIVHASQKFTERKEWVFAILDKMKAQNISKGYLYDNEKTNKLLLINWGVPVESLLASALNGDKPNRTFVTDKPEGIKNRMVTSGKDMIGCFNTWNYKVLNPYYFQIDTSSSYHIIKE
jgi:hypothetical protein